MLSIIHTDQFHTVSQLKEVPKTTHFLVTLGLKCLPDSSFYFIPFSEILVLNDTKNICWHISERVDTVGKGQGGAGFACPQ